MVDVDILEIILIILLGNFFIQVDKPDILLDIDNILKYSQDILVIGVGKLLADARKQEDNLNILADIINILLYNSVSLLNKSVIFSVILASPVSIFGIRSFNGL